MDNERYKEAIDTMARWCYEGDKPNISDGDFLTKVSAYGGGLYIMSILTGKLTEEIRSEVMDAYCRRYRKVENG